MFGRAKTGLAVALAAVTAMSLAACSSSNATATKTTNNASTAPIGKAASLLPAGVRDSGTFKVGMEIDYPPMEYYKTGTQTPTGLDVELGKALAKKLGLTPEFVNTKWAGLIPALDTHRYDVIMSSMGDFTDRQKQVDFVDYLNIGEGGIVKKANATKFSTRSSLCGKKVSAQTGTVAIKAANDLSAQCASDGKPKIQISTFPDDNSGLLAVRTGRVDLHIMDLPSAIYEQKTAGDGNTYNVVLPNITGGVPYGIGVAKGQPQLVKAIKTALNEIISDGEYATILKKYDLSRGAVKSAVVDGGKTSSQ